MFIYQFAFLKGGIYLTRAHVLHVPRATPFPSNSPLTEPTRAFYRPEIEEKPKLWHRCCSHRILLGQPAFLHLSAESNCWVLPATQTKHQNGLPTFPQRPELNAKVFTMLFTFTTAFKDMETCARFFPHMDCRHQSNEAPLQLALIPRLWSSKTLK